MRKLKNVVILIIGVMGVCWLLQKCNVLPSFKSIFKSQPVTIDETPVLIKDIKSIGQLITYSYFDEVVADSAVITPGSTFVDAFNHLSPVPILPSANKQLVIIGRGKILAGTDLSLLTDSSIILRNDTITIALPKPMILSAILNPQDFETFIEKGNWTSQEVTLVKLKARKKMEQRALQRNILGKAGVQSKAIIEDFLRNMGYKKIVFL